MRKRSVALCGVPGAPVLAAALTTDARCEVVAIVTSRIRLLAAMDRWRPDVIFIGSTVPSARELCEELMMRSSDTKVLLLHADGRHASWFVQGLPARYLREVSLATVFDLIHGRRNDSSEQPPEGDPGGINRG